MTKGAKVAAVVVFVVVLAGGSALAYTATKNKANTTRLPLPSAGPPPPPPSPVAGDLKVLGDAITRTGGAYVSQGYNAVTGQKLTTGQIAANVATGGLAAPVEAAYNWAKKLF